MTSLTGMDRATGKVLAGDDHLGQSVADIVTTPIGSRPMNRDYGCLFLQLLDQPLHRATLMLCTMAIAIALARWEPRIAVQGVTYTGELATGLTAVTILSRRRDLAGNALTRLTIPLNR
ncbi:GPW/gp25 family protein [Novosphingobium sp. UBA1939]|uniref:GPW/gp25 family protein n=1 Tax=Novosphingobium sp. UBA1939 TaxID=1946982 RepID=UPI0025E2FC51|nr:GPW/gp25 family protein [Novosphingobium sp. UBA1939]